MALIRRADSPIQTPENWFDEIKKQELSSFSERFFSFFSWTESGKRRRAIEAIRDHLKTMENSRASIEANSCVTSSNIENIKRSLSSISTIITSARFKNPITLKENVGLVLKKFSSVLNFIAGCLETQSKADKEIIKKIDNQLVRLANDTKLYRKVREAEKNPDLNALRYGGERFVKSECAWDMGYNSCSDCRSGSHFHMEAIWIADTEKRGDAQRKITNLLQGRSRHELEKSANKYDNLFRRRESLCKIRENNKAQIAEINDLQAHNDSLIEYVSQESQQPPSYAQATHEPVNQLSSNDTRPPAFSPEFRPPSYDESESTAQQQLPPSYPSLFSLPPPSGTGNQIVRIPSPR